MPGIRAAVVRGVSELCGTCSHGAVCMHAARPRRKPVVQCEEFEVARQEAGRPMAHSGPAPKRRTAGRTDRAYAGLCVNCELRNKCMNAGQDGGVWHCEEYV